MKTLLLITILFSAGPCPADSLWWTVSTDKELVRHAAYNEEHAGFKALSLVGRCLDRLSEEKIQTILGEPIVLEVWELIRASEFLRALLVADVPLEKHARNPDDAAQPATRPAPKEE